MLRDMFINSIFGTTTAESITATFKNGTSADYTTDIFSLLVSDPATAEIISNETGEVYYTAAENYIAYPESYR